MFAMINEFRSTELADWFQDAYGQRGNGVDLRIKPIRGGLSSAVAQVSAPNTSGGRDLFVTKKIPALPTVEHAAYETLARAGLGNNAPRLLATIPTSGGTYLILEYVMRWRGWPWQEFRYAGLVLDTLALLHSSRAKPAIAQESYESELAELAEQSLRVLNRAATALGDPRLAHGRRLIRRFAAGLHRVRAELLGDPVFIHGDVHPGNVRVQSSKEGKRAVLLDWGRARRGSRFEDVASWLQCLSYWEPEAARRHDLLLGRYLRSSGLAIAITREHRRAYWLAAGSNALAGALIVHLTNAMLANKNAARQRSIAAALDWLRILRRALYYWTSPADRRFGTA